MEPELSALIERVARLEARLERVEHSPVPAPRSEASAPPPEPGDARGAATLIGRSLIMLGGAFFLRALTDSGAWPGFVGAVVGLAYATVMLVLAERAQRAGALASASFHGGTALAVACPLIDELQLRYHLIDGHAGAALLLVVVLAAGLVARRQIVLAWLTVVAAVATSFVLVAQTREMVPWLWVLTGATAMAAWLARRLGARWLLAPPISAGTLLAVMLSQLVLLERSPHPAWAASLALTGFFLTAIAALWLVPTLSPVEMGEACVLGGVALEAVRLPGVGPAIALALAAAAARVRARERFWSWYFVAVVLVGLMGALDGPALAFAELAVAAALLVLPGEGDRQALAAVALAAFPSGLALFVWNSLAATPAAPEISALVVLAAALALALRRREVADLALAFLGVLALITWLGARALAGPPVVLATLRTAVLCAGVIAAALLSRRVRAATHLVYPTLALAGAKLLWEDFRIGVAAGLFVDLALVGLVLIVAPRLRVAAATTARNG